MSHTPTSSGHARAASAALAVPLALVNAFSAFGQALWAYDHVAPHAWQSYARWVTAGLFALALESIATYLSVEAHGALLAGQSVALLRAGSYVTGGVMAYLNYWHFAGASMAPNATAVSFAMLSALSPWLWAIRSRAINRDRLRAMHMLDERGVKLARVRWVWHPIMALGVTRWAAWSGVVEPAAAVTGWEAQRADQERAMIKRKTRHGQAQDAPTVDHGASDGAHGAPLHAIVVDHGAADAPLALPSVPDRATMRAMIHVGFTHGTPVAQLARDHGVPLRTVQNWHANWRANINTKEGS